jgi:hypothetical protein
LLKRIVATAVLLAASVPAFAQAPAPPTAPQVRIVAMAPLSTLGTEDTSAATKQVTLQIEQAIGALPNTKVITAAQTTQAITKAKKPQLKVCEGDAKCLSDLGKLVGATIVVDGQVAGLGDSRVVYLGATDVASGNELRSVTLQVSAGKEDKTGGAAGAAARLFEPDRYKGTLHLAIDVKGATVYINGQKATPNGKGEIPVLVGTQAVRVTHPEYRDFVRFVDIPFEKTLDVDVPMQQFPVIKHDVQGKPINTDQIQYVDPPFYRKPVFYVPVIVVLAIGIGYTSYRLAHDFPNGDACRQVGGEMCTQ